jgi:type IV secretory pathway ATPase VirB11/archaellum biosynthesis ATPase/intein/homing endonuclease
MVDYEVIENTVRINALNWAIEPSIEDSEACMAVVIDTLLEVKNAERVILAEAREREYDFEQVKLLREIAQAYNKILNEDKLISINKFGPKICEKFFPKRLTDLHFLVGEVLRKDPIGAYVRLQKMIAYEKMAEEKAPNQFKTCHREYLENVLLPMEKILSNCKLIQLVKPKLSQFKFGDRSFYREIFHPLIRPNFMLTRYMLMPPKNGQSLKKYFVGKTSVEIFKVPGKIRYVYHVIPPEFVLSEEKYAILDAARRYLTAHRPSETEFTEPEKAREVFMNISRDLIRDVARGMGKELSPKEIEELAEILTRYTAGFGVLEILLADENIQDVYINSPIGTTPIYINHAEFEECETNLIPTREDAESWATRFRLYSGRPLDEANPVLDTELILPGGRARVAAITRTLSPYGLGYAFRRHREKPWTFPLFIKAGFFDSLYAGLMSFIIDGGRSLLVAGGRGSGKTSLLGAIMLEIMKKFRICLVEDSVAGDSEILIKRNGRFERTSVGNLIDELITKYGCIKIDGREILNKNPEKIQVFSIDSKGKLTLSTVSSFVRHKTSKPIYEVETRTGRRIRTTGDHSLFTLGNEGKIEPVKVSELKVGDYLAVPRILRFDNKGIEEVNLLDYIDKLQDVRFYGKGIKKLIEENKNLIKKLAIELGYKVQDQHKYPQVVQSWKKKISLPAKVVSLLIKNGVKLDAEELKIKCEGKSHSLPVKIVLDEDFLTFLGLWLADGCYDKKSVIVSVVDKDTRKCVKRVAKRFGINVRMHSDGFSLILSSKLLKEVMMKVFELKGDAYSKRIPIWCYSLSRAQISHLLKGVFSGDGYLSKYEVAISLTSLSLIKDIQTLLLGFGIISRIGRMNERDKTYSCRISGIKNIFQFFNEVGFLQEERMRRLGEMCCKAVSHDVTDIIPFSPIFKEKMSLEIPNFNSHDYIKRGYNIGRNCLNEILVEYGHETEIFEKMNLLANSDIFWDQVRSIKAIGSREDYVYDFSIPGNENFVCENFIAHNTLELPAVQLRELGYNIERLKTRSVITRVEAELPAEEALRTALRLGDSVLIVGEVRSLEAQALFEAMRIGALANLVAGTIHGESAYGVYDRVVNDLKVPPTSFKAMDVITICNLLKTPDGLRRFRRVTELTEVRKHWKQDPADEGGFVPLMEYSAKEDRLKPTDVLINGESFVLNEIAKRVREWHGNWDAVWDNILLRGKIKQTMVDFAKQLNRDDILEAEMVVESNEAFHMISEEVREEVGSLDSKMIYEKWLNWFKERIK